MKRYPLLYLILGMAAAVLTGMLIVMIGLNPPEKDLRLLVLFMSLTGFSTVLLAYWLYERGWISQFYSLRWTLLTSLIITILLVLLNVWITAQLMFISQHDFILTSALLAFAGLTAFIFGLLVANMITVRIHALSEAAEQLAHGKLETRLEVSGKDELAEFARTFNWMAESLQQLDAQKRQVEQTRRDLIAGVSHDLRTPLTAIRAMLESIDDGIITDTDTTNRYIRQSLSEVDHLNHLIDDLLELARLDGGKFELEFVSTSLRQLINDCIQRMSIPAQQRGLTLHQELAEDIDPILIAPDKIERVLLNLLDNALRYTPPQGEIHVKAFRRNGQVQVEIWNSSASIDPVHLPHLFSTFYRVQPTRVREEDGHRSMGLGLAIARRFVEAHHGSITVESSPQQGTTFCVSLPRP